MVRPSPVEIRKTISGLVPPIPFEKMARAILGPRYTLSLVICGDELSRRMNKTYRKKTYIPNVLSFPLGKNDGEIFLNVRQAARETKAYGTTSPKHLARLFVHGCFHLKGLSHGRTMDSAEKRILRRFGLLAPERV